MNIYEIAQLAKVSISTVSRVINGKPGVRPELRRKVQEVIEQNHYRPSFLAKGLAHQKTHTIGIVMPGINSYFTDIIEAINNWCKEKKYNIMITANSRFTNNPEREIDNFHVLCENQVDGIILFASMITDKHKEVLQEVIKQIPIVIVDHEVEELDIPCILQDHYQGARSAMQHLLECGHKRIAYIGGPGYDASVQQRLKAYQDTLKEAGILVEKEYVRQGDFSMESGYKEILNLLAEAKNKPTALFAANDNMAIGAIKGIVEKGLQVPEDISVVGFDDIEMAEYYHPSLTTIHQDQYAIGMQAAELLFELMQNGKVKTNKIIMKQTLKVRQSTREIEE